MKNRHWNNQAKSGSLLAIVGALLLSAGTAFGQADLPKAEDLIDKYIEATGGKAARAKVKARLIKGTLEIPAMNAKGDLTVYQMRPNMSYVVVDVPNLTHQEKGYDGQVAWQRESRAGLRLLEGAELEEMRHESDFDNELNWRDRYAKAETVDVENVEGSPAYKVELTDKNGQKTLQYFDKNTHLLVRTDSIFESQMGPIPVEAYISDYRKNGDLLQSYKQRQVTAGMEQIVTIASIELNPQFEKERFALPEDVKALVIEKKKSESNASSKPAAP